MLRTRIVAGLLTVIPIWVTWKVVEFVFDTMKSATEPIAWSVARRVQEGQTPPSDYDPKLESEIVSRFLHQALEENPEVMGDIPPGQWHHGVDVITNKLSSVLQEVREPPAAAIGESYLQWLVPVLAVLLTLFFLYFLGLLGASVFGSRLIRLIERLFERVPLVKSVYKSTKQVVISLGGAQQASFQRVVLVEFPRPGMKCIGFLTAVMKDSDTGRDMASIFIATTPNPTTGYMQIVPLEEVSETNWTVEEAVKLVMSGGVLSPATVAFDKIHPVKWTRPAPGKITTEARRPGER